MYKPKNPTPIKSVIYEYDIDGVFARTKFPHAFLKHLQGFTKKYGIMLSIRMQHPHEDSNRRTSDISFSVKPSTFNTKTNFLNRIAHGKIPKEVGLVSSIFNVEDNRVPGAFAPDAQALSESDDIAKNIRKYEKEVLEIKTLGKRVCYSAPANLTQDGQVIGIITKHYIQESETLYSILDKIRDKSYTFKEIKDGKMYVSYESKDGQNYNIMINLNDIYALEDGSNLGITPFKNTNKLSVNELEAIIAASEKTNNLGRFHAPLFFQKDNSDPFSYIPLMVHAGYNGQALTSDADLGHIGTPLNLPKSARFCFQSKKMPISEYLNKIEELINDLNALDLRSQIESKEEASNPFSPDTFAKIASKALQYYQSNISNLELNTVGASTVYSLVMQYLFNHDESDEFRAIKEEIMWMHGAEEIHPGAQPEEFKGMLVSWKDKFYVTSDEKAYLDFLLDDRDMLKIQDLGVHPYWLRNRSVEENVHGFDLSKYWLDIIKIQALNHALNGQEDSNDFFECLIFQITSLPRKNKVNENAIDKIYNVKKEVDIILKENNIKLMKQEIDKIYDIYAENKIDIVPIQTDKKPAADGHANPRFS